MYQYDPLRDFLMLLLLSFLCGAFTGAALGYRLAVRHKRQARRDASLEYGVPPAQDVQAESAALEAVEATKPSEAWIDRLEQEINGK